MTTLRIIGDVHGQVEADDLLIGQTRPYLDLIATVPYSVQIGDMGDGQTYQQLMTHVDPTRHRFIPGNHEYYPGLPPHSLGDFGAVSWGGVEFFFVRGAASSDKENLLRVGQQHGRTLWFAEEELSDDQMRRAEAEYRQAKPTIVLTHDAPADIARRIWDYTRQVKYSRPGAVFTPSRTNVFLSRLWGQHAPKLWVFGHHHCNWRTREGDTLFVCVGELGVLDIDAAGGCADG